MLEWRSVYLVCGFVEISILSVNVAVLCVMWMDLVIVEGCGIVARILARLSSRSMAFRVVGSLSECICLCLFVLLFTCFHTLPRYK